MASIVTNAPSKSSNCNNLGMAVISLDLLSTACWPNSRRFSLAQALNQVQGAFTGGGVERVPQRLAIDGHESAFGRRDQRPDPVEEAVTEGSGVQPGEDAAEGIM